MRRERRTAGFVAKRAPSAITPAEAQYVEEVALFYEQQSLPRMAGRIMGWLMICDPPHQTLAQLEDVLQASKGSISTMTRLLAQLGLIKRTSVPGDRRDYVSMPPGVFSRLMQDRAQLTSAVRQLAEHGLQVLRGAPADRLGRLHEMRDFYAFMEREMPLLMERWQKEARRKPA